MIIFRSSHPLLGVSRRAECASACHWALSMLSSQMWGSGSHPLMTFRWGGSSALPSALLAPSWGTHGTSPYHLASSEQAYEGRSLLGSAAGGVRGDWSVAAEGTQKLRSPLGPTRTGSGDAGVLIATPCTTLTSLTDAI